MVDSERKPAVVPIRAAAKKARTLPKRSIIIEKGPVLEGLDEPVKVRLEELTLTNGESLRFPARTFDDGSAEKPAAPIRAPWIARQVSVGSSARTQLAFAKRGIVTPEMAAAAIRESGKYGPDMLVTPEAVMTEIAAGRAVIPANIRHPELEPLVIGKAFSVKINANIGASALGSDLAAEVEKLKLSVRFGADTVMDLSAGVPGLDRIRTAILRASPVPIGTVPIYEAYDRAGGVPAKLTWEIFKTVLLEQAEQGVDYWTIHAGLLADLLPAAGRRLLGIVSRGGGVMASRMMKTGEENFAFTHFDEILDICRRYDVALSLGDGLRPGCIADACDEAQYGELRAIAGLVKRCRDADVQVFVEGPGHVPMNRIEENQRLEEKLTDDAPFYTLGPLVADIGAGLDHLTAAIGAAQIGWYGTSMLCYVTPSEHLALPTAEDVKAGLLAFRLAAHAADLAKGLPGAQRWDDAMARARAEFRWHDQFALTLDPEHAERVWSRDMPEDCGHEPGYCAMCGPRFCPIRLNKALKKLA